MDLSTIEGLTEEQKASIMAAHDTDVSGLKTKNEQLLSEKKGIQQTAAEQEQALEESRKVAQDAKAAELEAQGKYDEAQKLREEERAKLVANAEAEAKKHKDLLDSYHKANAINEVLSSVDDRFKPFVKSQLESVVNISYNEQGEAITAFKDGEKQFNSVSEFLNGVKESDSWKSVLKGANSSGAGAQQSNSSGGQDLKWSEMNTEQKAQHLADNPPQRQ